MYESGDEFLHGAFYSLIVLIPTMPVTFLQPHVTSSLLTQQAKSINELS